MTALTIIKTEQTDFRQQWQSLRQKLSLEGELLGNGQRMEQVRRIVERVRLHGDEAIAQLTTELDKVEISPEAFRISEQQLRQAHRQLDETLLAALQDAIENVRSYQKQIKVKKQPDWSCCGARLGVRYHPLQRVGVCVPGASAPLVSTVVMTVVPAQVAGVKEIAVVSPPRHQGGIHPVILGLCYELKVTDVYCIGGAQAVAALAFGTGHIKKVDKIVGPGGWWGQLAKKEVHGLVGIDSFAGPSEVLIIADDSARPEWVAADMLSQAEHNPGSAVLVTDSEELADAVARHVDLQLAKLDRSEETTSCMREFCLTVVTGDLDEAVALANEFAPEHLQIECRDCDDIAGQIVNAGAVFIGHYSPVAAGDYFAGPSHTLPTGGSARFFGALNVNDFLKQSSIIKYDRKGLENAADKIEKIALAEGLDAHARSVKIRLTE